MNKVIKIAEQYLNATVSQRKYLVDYYNRLCLPLVEPTMRYEMKLSDNWCAMFTSVIAHKAGIGNKSFPYGVSVAHQVEQARKRNQYSENVSGVAVGDLVVFDWNSNGVVNHVGFVSGIGQGFIETIEGNYSNTVKRRHFKKSAPFISGIIYVDKYPRYLDPRIEKLVADTMIGLYGNGSERINLLGADYETVQARINEIMG